MKEIITPYDIQRVLECQSIAREKGAYWTVGTDKIVLYKMDPQPTNTQKEEKIGEYNTLSELEEALNNL